jgi:hypothetical protein
MYEREKQQLWTIFAAAAIARGNPANQAGALADEMLKEHAKRFPPEPEGDGEI